MKPIFLMLAFCSALLPAYAENPDAEIPVFESPQAIYTRMRLAPKTTSSILAPSPALTEKYVMRYSRNVSFHPTAAPSTSCNAADFIGALLLQSAIDAIPHTIY